MQTYLQLYIISNEIWPCQASPSFKSISVRCLGPKVILRFNYHKPRRAYGFAYMMSRFLRNFSPTNPISGSASTRTVNCNDPRPSPRGQAQLPVHRSQFSRQMAVCLGKFTPCAGVFEVGPPYDSQAFPCKKFPPQKKSGRNS